MPKELIRLANCTMAFDGEVVLDNINLYINDQEFLTLLGPSGCGKTTTLRIIGGFQTPTQGDVFFDGVRINDVPPHKRTINTVFQRYALFPHLNVFENIAFGLRIPKTDPESRRKVKLPESEIQERVLEMLKVVNLKGFEKRAVSSLSGGQHPCSGEPAQGPSAGRASGRAGSASAQGYADRTQAHPAGHGHHLHLRHPRPGGGPGHVRHCGGHGRGKDPADRHPGGHL